MKPVVMVSVGGYWCYYPPLYFNRSFNQAPVAVAGVWWKAVITITNLIFKQCSYTFIQGYTTYVIHNYSPNYTVHSFSIYFLTDSVFTIVLNFIASYNIVIWKCLEFNNEHNFKLFCCAHHKCMRLNNLQFFQHLHLVLTSNKRGYIRLI